MRGEYKVLHSFLEKACKDSRLDKGHLAVFVALFHFWECQDFRLPLGLYGSQVMEIAKISSKATYNRILKDLTSYRYIRYEPSFYKFKASLFELTLIE